MNVEELFEAIRPKTVLNIGAYDCVDALTFAKEGCDVYAFEPMNIPREEHKNIQFIQVAISNENKVAEFYVSDNGCSGSLNEPKNHIAIWPRVKFTHKQMVNCMTLDSWYEGFNKPIDLIFADVNGSEAELIEGATNALKNTKYLFIEVSDKELYKGQKSINEIIAMLPGWSLVGKYNDYERFADILLKNESCN